MELEKLFETIKYMDPVSSKEVEEVEDQIAFETEKLAKLLENGETDSALKAIDKINNLLNERKIGLKNSR